MDPNSRRANSRGLILFLAIGLPVLVLTAVSLCVLWRYWGKKHYLKNVALRESAATGGADVELPTYRPARRDGRVGIGPPAYEESGRAPPVYR